VDVDHTLRHINLMAEILKEDFLFELDCFTFLHLFVILLSGQKL
jgi:hypothetical protein